MRAHPHRVMIRTVTEMADMDVDALRAASEESARSAMRMARSKPSSTTFTFRSERLSASCTSG